MTRSVLQLGTQPERMTKIEYRGCTVSIQTSLLGGVYKDPTYAISKDGEFIHHGAQRGYFAVLDAAKSAAEKSGKKRVRVDRQKRSVHALSHLCVAISMLQRRRDCDSCETRNCQPQSETIKFSYPFRRIARILLDIERAWVFSAVSVSGPPVLSHTSFDASSHS